MSRKDYLKPTMKVVKLQHRCNILVVSGEPTSVQSSRNSYGAATEDEWD